MPGPDDDWGKDDKVVGSGEASLQGMPKADADYIRSLASGRTGFPTGAAMKTPYWQQKLEQVIAYDPTFEQADFSSRANARKKFAAGPEADSITSLGTALQHARNLLRSGTAVTKRNFEGAASPLNGVLAGGRRLFHDKDEARMGLDMQAFTDELETSFTKGGGTAGGREDWRKKFSDAQTPTEFKSVMDEAISLLASRIEAKQGQLKRALGPSGNIGDFFTPEQRDAYKEVTGRSLANYDPSGMSGNDTGGEPPAGGNIAPPTGGAPNTPPSDPTGGSPSGGGISPYFKALNESGGAITNDQGKPIISPNVTSEVDTAAKERNGRLLAMVSAGEPDDKILAAASSLGIDPATTGLNAILAYRKKTGLTKFADTTDYNIRRPTTTGERIVNTVVSNPIATFGGEAGNAAAAGLPQAMARGVGGENVRNGLDAIHNTNPRATLGGQLVGTALGAAGGEALAGKGLLKLGASAETTAALAPRIGDATYGAISGATSNPDAPVSGALLGSVAALGGGELGRGLAAGVSGAIAPTGGNAAPLYEAGVRPSLGQRVVAGGSDSGLGVVKRTIGTAINGTEEAAQSIPGVGFFIKGTRQRARNQFQTGGFNNVLSDIGLELPADAQRGPAAFRYMDKAHSDAYDGVLPRMSAVADPQAISDTQAIMSSAANGGLAADSAARFQKIIDDQVTRRMSGPNLAGQDLKDALSGIGKKIRTLRNSPQGDGELADFLENYAQVIKESAARNSAPEDASRLADIDRSYAKGVALANAAARAGGETAEFSPTQLLRSSQQVTGGTRSRAFLRGEGLLQDYAQSGMSLVDRLPNSGTADRMLTGQALFGGGAGLLGAVNPTTAAAAGVLSLPYAPIVRNASTALLAPRNSARLNTLGDLIRSNAQIPGAIGAGELLQLPSQYGN